MAAAAVVVGVATVVTVASLVATLAAVVLAAATAWELTAWFATTAVSPPKVRTLASVQPEVKIAFHLFFARG